MGTWPAPARQIKTHTPLPGPLAPQLAHHLFQVSPDALVAPGEVVEDGYGWEDGLHVRSLLQSRKNAPAAVPRTTLSPGDMFS